MSASTKYFKTAIIQYQYRDDVQLRDQLLYIAMSCQKNIDSQS